MSRSSQQGFLGTTILYLPTLTNALQYNALHYITRLSLYLSISHTHTHTLTHIPVDLRQHAHLQVATRRFVQPRNLPRERGVWPHSDLKHVVGRWVGRWVGGWVGACLGACVGGWVCILQAGVVCCLEYNQCCLRFAVGICLYLFYC